MTTGTGTTPDADGIRDTRAKRRADRLQALYDDAKLRARAEHDAAAFRAIAGIRGRHRLQTIVGRLGGTT